MDAVEIPNWLVFIERPFPSANMVLIKGREPVLIDTGFGSDLGETDRLIREAGVEPASLKMVINSHYHCDHVGGNWGLQSRYKVPIAAHRLEAALVNDRDREACAAVWLDQPVEPYTVNEMLDDGDEIRGGDTVVRVIHTPGHTLGHLSFYIAEGEVLICGDAVHSDDVCWLNPFREGAGALNRAMESIRRLQGLRVRWACSGHGPALLNPTQAFTKALSRYEKWEREPEKIAWHAMKRIFTYSLMLQNGLAEKDIKPYLLTCPWYLDYVVHVFEKGPEEFVEVFLDELHRSGAVRLDEGRMVPTAAYSVPAEGWATMPTTPGEWPV